MPPYYILPLMWIISITILSASSHLLSIIQSFGYGYQIILDFEWSTIKTEDITAIPTQQCKAHRVLPTESNVFATELTTSKLLTMF